MIFYWLKFTNMGFRGLPLAISFSLQLNLAGTSTKVKEICEFFGESLGVRESISQIMMISD